jgi:N-hydroxyarylamine O-acetyltransferase
VPRWRVGLVWGERSRMNPGAPSLFDLDAYLARIGYAGAQSPTAAVLAALHLAHATHVPFENLDIQLGRPIRLDLDSLQVKLVHGRRGGYCFEQNTLFAAALEEVGFRVTRLAARVRLGTTEVLPRTHMLLRVETDGAAWLADVGFGGGGPLRPVPLEPGRVTPQFGREYRIAEEAGLRVLQSRQGDAWLDLYAFTLEPQFPVDFKLANHYTSTYPTSSFVQGLIAQLPTPEGCRVLRNRSFTVERGADVSCRTIVDDEELLRVLAEAFGLAFPPGTRFRCLAPPV